MMGGRHYNHEMQADMMSTPRSLLTAVARGEAKCAVGDHDEQTVPANRRVYGPYGVHWPTGTRYCGRCKVVLPESGADR